MRELTPLGEERAKDNWLQYRANIYKSFPASKNLDEHERDVIAEIVLDLYKNKTPMKFVYGNTREYIDNIMYYYLRFLIRTGQYTPSEIDFIDFGQLSTNIHGFSDGSNLVNRLNDPEKKVIFIMDVFGIYGKNVEMLKEQLKKIAFSQRNKQLFLICGTPESNEIKKIFSDFLSNNNMEEINTTRLYLLGKKNRR